MEDVEKKHLYPGRNLNPLLVFPKCVFVLITMVFVVQNTGFHLYHAIWSHCVTLPGRLHHYVSLLDEETDKEIELTFPTIKRRAHIKVRILVCNLGT